MSENSNLIFTAMVAIMQDVDVIKKEKRNTQGAGFNYRGIDDVMNSLHESFAKHGVFITTEVLERKEVERQSKSGGTLFWVTITVQFTFHAQDGSSISSVIYGTAMDSGDKADNKCMSIALKYCLLQAFLIPTEDIQDPDAQTHEVKPKTELTEALWLKLLPRLKAGEKGISEMIRKTYKLTDDQEFTLNTYKGI